MRNTNRTFFVIIFFFLSVLIYAREVSATNQAIANASPGDYIIRASGEKVVLKQADIDHARRQLGTNTVPNRSVSTSNSRQSTNLTSNNPTGFIIVLLVLTTAIIIIFAIVSNKTTTDAENSGADEESVNKEEGIYMTDDLEKILSDNNLSEYIPILEQNKLDRIDLLSDISDADYEKMGITIMGDRKKLLKLFHKSEKQESPAQNEQTSPSQTVIVEQHKTHGVFIFMGVLISILLVLGIIYSL